jgi:predicted nucleotidyltransferase
LLLRGDRITVPAQHQRRFKKAARGDAQPDSDYDIAVFSTSSR